MRIQKTNYFTNGHPAKLNYKQQQTPPFGNLIIKEPIPTDILRALIKSEEIKKLTNVFQKVDRDIKVEYKALRGVKEYCSANEKLETVFIKIAKNKQEVLTLRSIYGQISKIISNKGFAEETLDIYHQLLASRSNNVAIRTILRNEQDNFSKSINPKTNKKSFWQRLFGKK